MKRRIGIFGGSFNPIHFGHLQVAKFCQKKIDLNDIYFVPNFLNPFKKKNTLWTNPTHKVKMLQIALKDYPHFHINSFEIENEHKNYTIDTIEYFSRQFPSDQLFFLGGDDILYRLHQWKRIDDILLLSQFIIYNRIKNPYKTNPIIQKYLSRFIFINSFIYNISSREIIKKINNNTSTRGLIPLKVADYIIANKLYETHHNT